MHGSRPGVKLLTVAPPSRDEGCSPTGIVGRRLARQLLAAGDQVRVLTPPDEHGPDERGPDERGPGERGPWPDGVEVVAGATRAFDGVDAVFLAGAHPSTVEASLASARAAGVRRIVLLSSHGPEYEQWNPPETWHWLAIERAVERSGIGWTHIRPSAVMGSVIAGTYPATGSDWPHSICTEGVVREAFLDSGHYPFIHEEDLAAVAAAALRTDRYAGTVLEAVGPPISTRARIRAIAAAIGRDIQGVELTPAGSREAWRRNGWPDGAIDVTLFALEEYGLRLAELTEWTLAQRPSVSEIIGRPPRTYDAWAAEHAALFG